MKNVSIMSLEGVSPMNLVNSSNRTGSAEEFQKCMDNAKGNTSTEVPVTSATKTSVVSEGKEVETADVENTVYKRTETTEVREEMVVDEVEQKIKELIKSVMDVEESELETVMDELGLTYLQLLDPANLQKLVMAVNGTTELTDFLTNENMLAQFTELTQNFEEIDWKSLTGMDKQEFLEFLEKAVDQTDLESGQTAVMDDLQGEQPQKIVTDIENVQDKLVYQDADVETDDGMVQYSKAERQQDIDETIASVGKNVEMNDAENPSSNQELFQSESEMKNEAFHQSVQETDTQPVTVMNFVENLTQATATENVSASSHMQQMIDIVHQVVEKIQTSIQGETTTMEMQLNPENLGKVMLTVSEKGGVMTASFTVQTDEAREALESQLHVLRENLEQKNLKVESVEVSVSDFDFNQSNQMGSGDQKDLKHGDGKRRNFRFDEEEQESGSTEEEAESVRRSVMQDSGSSVDYTA